MPDVPNDLYKALRDNFPLLCTDGVVVNKRRILLVRRTIIPYRGYWTLPGGHVDFGETVEHAVLREVLEETGIAARIMGLIDVFSRKQRDPWGHIISIAYLLKPDGFIPDAKSPKLDELDRLRWFLFDNLPKKIGFDHRDMIRKARVKYPEAFS